MRQSEGLEKYVDGFRDGSASLISKDMVIEGSIVTEAPTTLVVAGKICGSVQTEGDVVIVDGGSVLGGAKCKRLLVAGHLASGKEATSEVSCAVLHVASSGRIDGEDMTVHYGLVRMDPGAQIRARLVPNGQPTEASLLDGFGPSLSAPHGSGVPPALRAIATHEPAEAASASASRSAAAQARPEVTGGLSRTEAFAQSQSGGMSLAASQRPAVGGAA
jgi:cytoskeletal protein CcmA (bactofilin family)